MTVLLFVFFFIVDYRFSKIDGFDDIIINCNSERTGFKGDMGIGGAEDAEKVKS